MFSVNTPGDVSLLDVSVLKSKRFGKGPKSFRREAISNLLQFEKALEIGAGDAGDLIDACAFDFG
jgi:hypothetical protein